MKLHTITATAPSYWACYLINGDAGDLDPAELDAADAFADAIGGNCVDAVEAGFMHRHDAWDVCPFAADCATYTFLTSEAAP